MDTDKFKSIALNMETYKKLREMSDKKFEMPQSMAKTASFFIDQAFEGFKKKQIENAKRKA
jgi:hypothetical protein|tara:strand:+ start:483 stop:665 length:183 start_codon:yes stop_codon:yes gene_type:complete